MEYEIVKSKLFKVNGMKNSERSKNEFVAINLHFDNTHITDSSVEKAVILRCIV